METDVQIDDTNPQKKRLEQHKERGTWERVVQERVRGRDGKISCLGNWWQSSPKSQFVWNIYKDFVSVKFLYPFDKCLKFCQILKVKWFWLEQHNKFFLKYTPTIIRWPLGGQNCLPEKRQLREKSRCYEQIIKVYSKKKIGDFPGGPVVKTPCSQCRGPRFDTWSGN